ncbi:carboxylesterase family protein [Amycolatopsis lurida]
MEGTLAFRGIRYARADRFGPAEVLPFQGADPESPRGPVPPQNPSRFNVLLGPPAALDQDEDCQFLSVFTSGLSGRRPVMIWFHGGAFITGGGELPWYDGTLLAAEQDVVVVSVTARLGALGYLFPEGEGAAERPSPATTDQMAAIEWVHRNIESFGGDPDDITLFGQSAGGFSLEVMLRWGLGPYVRAAIIQSGFIGQPSLSHDPASVTRQAADFVALLGKDPRSSSTAELLSAQVEFARRAGTVEVWGPVRPSEEKRIEVSLLAGWTRHDTFPYVAMENGVFEPYPRHLETFSEEVRRRNHHEIAVGTFEVLDEVVNGGQPAWLYEFDWEIPASGWGAPHCIELPFLLGDRHAWRAAPMLRGADWQRVEQQSRHLRAVWASFARHRRPGDEWIQYDPVTRTANSITDLFGTPARPHCGAPSQAEVGTDVAGHSKQEKV